MFGNSLRISILALACSSVALPAAAAPRATKYDGNWSVVISTNDGSCPSSIRYGVRIQNGRVIAGNDQATVDGQVTRVGTVMVNVQAGNQWAQGSGRLGSVSGGGIWQGQGSAGACSGTWMAQRVVPEGERDRTLYNYAPQGAAPAGEGVGAQAAACAARFHTYNAATGMYLGADGQRHRCL